MAYGNFTEVCKEVRKNIKIAISTVVLLYDQGTDKMISQELCPDILLLGLFAVAR